MTKLSYISCISSAVFVIFLSQSIYAAKPTWGSMAINLSSKLLNMLVQTPPNALTQTTSTAEPSQKNALEALLEVYSTDKAKLEFLLTLYKSIKQGTAKVEEVIIPKEVLTGLSLETINIICIHNGDVFKINPVIVNLLDELWETIIDSGEAIKSKRCITFCCKFCFNRLPHLEWFTAELVAPILLEIAKNAISMSTIRENLTIHIPVK